MALTQNERAKVAFYMRWGGLCSYPRTLQGLDPVRNLSLVVSDEGEPGGKGAGVLCHSEHIAWRGVGPQRFNIDGNSLEEQKELCDASQVLARSGCEALCEVLLSLSSDEPSRGRARPMLAERNRTGTQ
jgi:hypothetical protein